MVYFSDDCLWLEGKGNGWLLGIGGWKSMVSIGMEGMIWLLESLIWNIAHFSEQFS